MLASAQALVVRKSLVGMICKWEMSLGNMGNYIVPHKMIMIILIYIVYIILIVL